MVNGAPTNPITGTRPASAFTTSLNRLADVTEFVGIRNRQAVDIARGAHRIVDHRAFAGGEAQLQAHRLDRQQQIGENDGGVDVQNLHGLQRDLRRQIGPFADFQNPVLGADIAVLLHVAPGLAHEPDRPDIGRPAPAGIEKAAVHWSHAHSI